MPEPHFSPALFKFLRDLEKNNNREWFQTHKPRFEEHVKAPLLRFIEDIEAPLMKVSKHIVADPSPSGGSMFRIYRDVRFSKDKRPYKTHAAAQFRHATGKDAHAPGYYMHLAPGDIFVGGGIWRPDSKSLKAIRERMAAHPKEWKKALSGKSFNEHFALGGESLKRPPKGFDAEHPLIGDLKRKDFIAGCSFKQADVVKADFLKTVVQRFKAMSGLMRFLTGALGVPF